jgi:hypothetical protein
VVDVAERPVLVGLGDNGIDPSAQSEPVGGFGVDRRPRAV